MRRESTVEISVENADGTFSDVNAKVFEIRPADVYKAYDAAKEKGLEIFFEDEYYISRCTSLSVTQLKTLYPSDLELLLTKFREVNSSFLAPWPTIKKLVAKVGLVEWIGQILETSGVKEKLGETLAETFSAIAQDSQNEVITEPGTTDGSIS